MKQTLIVFQTINSKKKVQFPDCTKIKLNVLLSVSPRRKRKRSASNVKPAKSPTKNENKQSRSQSESSKKSATENVRSSRKERSKTETSSSRKTKENDENTARSRIHEPLVMIKIGKHTMIDFAVKGRHKNGRSATNRHGEPPN